MNRQITPPRQTITNITHVANIANFDLSALSSINISGQDEEGSADADALALFTQTSSWPKHSQPLRRWKTRGSTLEVAVGSGAGQELSKFSVSEGEFLKECREIGFSPAFLGKLVGKSSMFEHHFTFGAIANRPLSLEIAMSTYENDSFTFFLRVDLVKKVGRALVFLKLHGCVRDDEVPLSEGQFIQWLQRHGDTLNNHPFLIANCVLTFYQYRSYSYVGWRKDLYNMESLLGVTERAAVYKDTGYQTLSFNYDKLNADLARLSRQAADTTLSVSTMLHHATALLRLAELVESKNKSAFGTSATSSAWPSSFTKEEIRSTILRAELFLKNAAMVDRLVESMRAVLYNRITKHDSNSMKTIAVVTLFFLPSTFVSAVFSTGVFDFRAGEGEHQQPQTITRWAWVYLLVCLLLTFLTLLLWLFWYLWGSLWLEKLHLTRAAHTSDSINGGDEDSQRSKGRGLGSGRVSSQRKSQGITTTYNRCR